MKDKTITELIAHWSQTFGLPMKQGLGFPSRDRMELALRLIDEELAEVKQAIDNRDLVEVQDGLGDLLWVTIRAMMEFGIDPPTTIKNIYDSNMSKADFTEEDAMKTKAKYDKQGINTYMKFVGPAIITYRFSDNKVLKSHRFKTPKL